MAPFLSYSSGERSLGGRGRGRGRGSYRGRGRAGRWGFGRGEAVGPRHVRRHNDETSHSDHGLPKIGHFDGRKHQWIRSPRFTKEIGGIKNNEEPETGHKNIPGNRKINMLDKVAIVSNITEEYGNRTAIRNASHRVMIKNNNNQLMVSSKIPTQTAASAIVSKEILQDKGEQTRHLAAQGQTMKREGKNKLVALRTLNNVKGKKHPQEPPQQLQQLATKGQTLIREGKNKLVTQSDFYSGKAESLKKIRRQTIHGIQSSSFSVDETPLDIAADRKPKPNESVIDLVDRRISQEKKRPMYSSKKKNNNESGAEVHSTNTSLHSSSFFGNHTKRRKVEKVGRVWTRHNEEDTPICPTFLRGEHCQNEDCLKRHTIPKGYEMPVCSFFQRHGQCLRGETCLFRHIKVNTNALIRPKFDRNTDKNYRA